MFERACLENRSQKGFTLVEIVLYIAGTVILLFVIVELYAIILQTRVKSELVSEVEQQGALVMGRLEQSIAEAQAISAPSAGTIASTLSLDVVSAAADPTKYDLADGSVRINEGGQPPVFLTNDLVTASGLSFHNLSRTGTEGNIRAWFTLSAKGTSSRSELRYSRTFYVSASVRPN